MPLFQKSVITKHLSSQDKSKLALKWNVFKNHFHNSIIQENIRNSKEEQYQGEFLIDLFVNVLDYVKNPTPNFSLTTEYKNVKDSKKADGAILVDNRVKAVIELKGTNTTDLGKIEVQAFGYKNNQPDCVYVVTSNFEKLRFYIDNATEFLEFNLFQLTEKEFELLYLCLAYENIVNDVPKKLKEQSLSKEKDITKALYTDYSQFKRELHQDLVKQNPAFDALELFKKSQKLLDRFLFLFFAEDRQLLPPNSVRLILNDWRDLQERDENVPLYKRFKKYFEYLNTGFKGKRYDVFAYNGGLFKPDDILDNIKIDDELLFKHTLKLSEYDFASEVDVNILGHIFENSLNELDEIKAQLEGGTISKSNTKRKKDGVFYTPKYITKYIVDNTVGKLCTDKKAEFKIIEEDYFTDKKRNILTKKPLLTKLTNYRNWLLQITICDPACGSGAFLNQALDFLINEHRYIDELEAKLLGEALVLSDIEKSILENNLFGVDLNEESVEIAKLSLWLRTAQPNRKLNDLNSNIKCGNSLIDDVTIAGGKAFNWQTAFPKIYENGGFDVIIGNPPYGASFNEEEKSYIVRKYKSHQYKFESYLYFYEKGINLINPKGILSFITPELFLRLEKSENIRKYILDYSTLLELKFCGENVFSDLKVNCVILTLIKEVQKNKTFAIITETELSSEFEFSTWEKTESLKINYEISSNNFELIDKIELNSTPLGNLGDSVQGLTAYDSYRGHSKELIKNRAFHFKEKVNDSCGKWLDGKNINRYSLTEGDEWLSYGDWLGASRERKFFENPRLLFREIPGQNKRIQATFSDEVYYYGHSITPFILNNTLETNKLFELLGIVNSRLISWYASRKSPNFSKKTFPKLNPKDIKEFPVKNLNLEQREIFIKKVKSIISLTKELQDHSLKFQRTLQRKFGLETLPRKLQDWYLLSYADFIIELTKRKIKLSLAHEAEWEEYFTKESNKVSALKTEIDEFDKGIDAMVYKLYDLTAEEIDIVENS